MLRAKLAKKSIRWLLVGKMAKKPKMLKKTLFFQWIWAPRPANLEAKMAPKSIQDRSKVDQKIDWKLDRFFDRFLVDVGSVLVGFWRPSWSQNQPEIDQSSICKPIENKVKKNIQKRRCRSCGPWWNLVSVP